MSLPLLTPAVPLFLPPQKEPPHAQNLPHIPTSHLPDDDLPRSALGHQARFFSPSLWCPSPAIRRRIPGATHEAVKSRAGAVVRSQMSRLNRRTWKGSKKAAALQDELDLFVWWHNMGIMGLR